MNLKSLMRKILLMVSSVLSSRLSFKLFVFVAVLALLDVFTTLYALNIGLVEGNPASVLVGDAFGPVAMCLVGTCATFAVFGFTAPVVPKAARLVAYFAIALKFAVVVSNFVHIFLS